MTKTPKLTALSHGAGCACKLSPAELHPLLEEMPAPDDPALLVGLDTADDAAVYRVSDDIAIVSTADFFTRSISGASPPPTPTPTCTRWGAPRSPR